MPTTRPRPSSTNAFINLRSAILGFGRVAFLGLQHATAAPAPLSALGHGGGGDEPEAEGPGLLGLYILAAVLVLLGGAFAGLTIAFMGQDGIYLKVLKDDIHESHTQRKAAGKVLSLLNYGKHWILVTLLLANVIVNESLPVVLDRCLGGGIEAIIGSTVLIVIFGEVVPQSICVRYGLPIGGSMAPIVRLMMWLTAPISWPIAKLLDRTLGIHEGTVYKKSGLKTLVTLHQTMGEVSERLNTDEVTIIRAVLDLKAKSVRSVMTPMEDVFTLSADAVLDEKLMGRILHAGYSRIPVHAPENKTDFVGMLLVKILITYDPEDCMQVKDFALAALPETGPATSCLDILNYFQDGKSHMALVTSAPGQDHGALGVVTLEDVIEELIGEEIVDESDVYIDVHKAIRRLAPAPTSTFLRRSSLGQQPPPHDDGDVDEGASTATRPGGDDERSASVSHEALGASPRTVTFMLRRSATGPDGMSSSSGIPVKPSMDALRQQLRHLGPSNPASNPKNVGSTNVTVKPGTGLTPVPSPFRRAEHMRDSSELSQRAPPLERLSSDEETPLLGARSSSVDKAKGNLRPETLNYGSGEADSQRAASGSSTVRPSLSIATDGSSTVIPGSEYGRASPKASPKASEHTTSPTASTGTENGGTRLHRTGTITESYVESGGVRKIVISSSGEEDAGNGNGNGIGETVAGPAGGSVPTVEPRGATAESHEESHETQGLLEDAVSPTTYAEAAASSSGGGGGGGGGSGSGGGGGHGIGRKPKKSKKKAGRRR